MELYKHQANALKRLDSYNKVAFYHDMGLGKTYTGAEKMHQLGEKVNLVICQKSKVDDWLTHFETNYRDVAEYNLTNKEEFTLFLQYIQYAPDKAKIIGVINYELAWRRPELKELKDFTLMLDESSLIQNDTAKRTKFISSLNYKNLILLSGTPTGGKYENLYSQLKMLGYNISKKMFYDQYINYHYDKRQGFPLLVIDGYKNVDRLKRKMRQYGCDFLKTEEVIELPDQTFIPLYVESTKEYRKFKKDAVITINERELVGDTALSKMLYERQLCGAYNETKLKAFTDLLESTQDRLIVFYNFNVELEQLKKICEDLNRSTSVVNGNGKDLTAYETHENSVTLIQYQAGSMGLNLQKSNKIIYFTPPLSSELYEQSKKRTHRIGQKDTCFYYNLIVSNSIEVAIYNTLKMRKDYTEELFRRSSVGKREIV